MQFVNGLAIPGGGTLAYATRVHRFTVDVDPASGAVDNVRVAETVQFTAGGSALNGLAPSPAGVLGNAFDPEGLVVDPRTGDFLVSDEYGPSLLEFDRAGALVRRFDAPANLVPRNAATGVPNFVSTAGGTDAGRAVNRGFEGLAVSPDGRYAYAMLQNAMLDEGAGDGYFARIAKYDLLTGEHAGQFFYRLETNAQGRGVSALVALGDDKFLVLERNNRGAGVGATLAGADKGVFQIDLAGATDVRARSVPAADAAAGTLPAGVAAVRKSAKLVDLDANTLASSIQCPAGATTGCVLTEGGAPATLTAAYRLLPGVLHAYAADVPGYAAPAAVPEPGTAALTAAGLALAEAAARRARAPR